MNAAIATDRFDEILEAMDNHQLDGSLFGVARGFMLLYNGYMEQTSEAFDAAFMEKLRTLEFIRVVNTPLQFSRISAAAYRVGDLRLKFYKYQETDKTNRCILMRGNADATNHYSFMDKTFDSVSLAWTADEQDFIKLQQHVRVLRKSEDGKVIWYVTAKAPETMRLGFLIEHKRQPGSLCSTVDDLSVELTSEFK